MAIKIMIADDHSMIREGLKSLLELEGDIQVVAEAEDGVDCLEKLKICTPDVLLLDINMPRKNGLEVLQTLKSSKSKVKVLVLTVHTGSGIEEQKLYQMQHDMQNADIEMLKNKKSVGMLNACLRLKMYTEDHVCFEIEGEEGVGTWITICIPMEYLSFAEGCVNGPVCKRGKEIC